MAGLRHLSLRVRLVAVMLLATVPAMITGILSVGQSAAQVLRSQAEQRVAEAADAMAAETLQWDDYFARAAVDLSGQAVVRSMDRQQLAPVLASMSQAYNGLATVQVMGLDGTEVARGDSLPPRNWSDREWFRKAAAGARITRQALLGRNTGRPVMCYAAPVHGDGGKVVGVVCAAVYLESLAKQIGVTRLGQRGFCFVVDGGGAVLTHPDPARARVLQDLHDYPPVHDALTGGAPVALSFADRAGARWLSNTVRLPNGWIVVGQQEEGEVLAAAHSYKTVAALIAIGTVVVMLAVTWLAVGRWLKPVANLTRAAAALAGGDWDLRVADGDPGELGVLARAFNRMSDELRRSYRTIEERVAGRTEELRQSNEQLHEARAELEQTLRQIRRSEADYRKLALVASRTDDAVIITDIRNRIEWVNEAFTRITEFRPEEAIGRHPGEVMTCSETDAEALEALDLALREREHTTLEFLNYSKSRRRYWLAADVSPIHDDAGNLVQFMAVARDITQRKAAEQALAESERFSRSTVDALTAHIAILDPTGRVVSVNRAWREFGSENHWPASIYCVGTNYLDACASPGGPCGAEGPAVAEGIRRVLAGEAEGFALEYAYHSEAEKRWFVVRVSPFAGEGLTRVVVAHENVTERRLAEDRLRHESLHDALTDLPNRALFNDRVGRCIKRMKRNPDYKFAVVFLDLDRFKVVNDSLGHAAGDKLLVTVAERLQEALRGTDSVGRAGTDGDVTIARLGGDEFTLLLDDLKDPVDAVLVAERVQKELSRPVQFGGQEIFTTVSIGIAHGAPSYGTAKDLLRDADAAMYRAKTLGKARHAVFDVTMHESAVARLRLESDLRRAVPRGELLLHYQPIVSLESRALVGFEALVRWNRDGKLTPPDQFIPVAEDTGLIVPIGAWVLEEACGQLQAWRRANPGVPPLTMAVNLSRRQLTDPGIVDTVADILRRTGTDPASIKLEITESVIIEDTSATLDILKRIKGLGVGLHIDDFGTGYSSLSCVHRFPIDGIKVDRGFVMNMAERRDYTAVVHAIVNLAHNLNMKVVAEGVESPDQVAFLQALDCDYGQGYFFSRPLPAEDAERLLRTALPDVVAA
jgi:diguanylate cyclase (GGDEF)-like protein/PAS domain S-box-containing protein